MLQASGLLKLMEQMKRPPVVYTVNYHRIGNRTVSAFDKGVYSASQQAFAEQIKHFAQYFRVLSCDEILNLPRTLETLDRDAVIVTFDDGYRDNYELAFPILKQYGVPGVFFIPTNILENPKLPWWDAVSYLVETTTKPQITIEFEGTHTFDLASSREQASRKILRLIKNATNLDYELFIQKLAQSCGISWEHTEELAGNLFLTPEMIRDMASSNMLFGTQTHSHFILSQLPEAQQAEELQLSRRKLEQVLGQKVELMSYPVGGLTAFTAATKRLAREAGYTAAYSFYGGLLHQGHTDWYDVPRESIEHGDDLAIVRARIQMLRLWNRRF